MRISRCLRSLCAAAVLLMLPQSAVQAVDDVINIEPRSPTSNADVRLIFNGFDGCCGPVPRAFESVEINGMTIEVVSIAALGGVLSPPTPPYAFTVDAGRLAAGLYTVRHLGREEGSFLLREIATREFTVNLGIKSAWIPSRPTEGDSLVFELTGIGSCPSVGSVERVGSSILRIPWSPGGCLSPPGEYTLATAAIAAPAPGSYSVEAVKEGFPYSVLGVEALEVFPENALLQNERFSVQSIWRTEEGDGHGQLVNQPTNDSALYWFFDPQNWEMMVKVLDGCAFNGHFWVFSSASTDVEVSLEVTDRSTGAEWTYENPAGNASVAVADTEAFPCE